MESLWHHAEKRKYGRSRPCDHWFTRVCVLLEGEMENTSVVVAIFLRDVNISTQRSNTSASYPSGVSDSSGRFKRPMFRFGVKIQIAY
jgi:hypothetical protein